MDHLPVRMTRQLRTNVSSVTPITVSKQTGTHLNETTAVNVYNLGQLVLAPELQRQGTTEWTITSGIDDDGPPKSCLPFRTQGVVLQGGVFVHTYH